MPQHVHAEPDGIAQNNATGKSLPVHKIGAIIHMLSEGQSVAKVANTLKVSRDAVYKHWRKHVNAVVAPRLNKRGRKQLFSQEQEDHILELLTSSDSNSADQVGNLLVLNNVVSSKPHKSTIIRAAQRAAKRSGSKLWVQRGKPPKGMTKATMQKRLAFALAHQNTDFSRVMFTDRKKFHFRFPGSKVAPSRWVLGSSSGSNHAVNQPNHPDCLNIYAGITKWGVTEVHVVAGSSKHTSQHTTKQGKPAKNITASEYKQVVTTTLLPGGQKLFTTQGISSWVLQQDNDLTHKAAVEQVKQWNAAKASSVQVLANWPPNSPDLNLIENVWSWVQREVDRMGCATFEEFKQAVLDKLAAVPKQHLTNLYKSMKNRLAAVVENGGGPTRW